MKVCPICGSPELERDERRDHWTNERYHDYYCRNCKHSRILERDLEDTEDRYSRFYHYYSL